MKKALTYQRALSFLNRGCDLGSSAYARSVQIPATAFPLRRPIVVTGLGLRGWRPFALAAGAALLVSLLFAGWPAFPWVTDQATIDIDDIGEAVAAFLAPANRSVAAAGNSG